jgi:type I restriction enzyme, S subunit
MWKTVNLGEACLVRRGTTITKKHAVEGDVPVIGGGTKPTYFHNEPNRAASCITVSGSGASAGFVNRWNMPIFASDCSTVEPKDEMQLPQFVYYYLLSQQQFIYDNFRSGAAQPHVYAKDIETLDFPVLPLAEQERIVAKLDAAFAEIDETIEVVKNKITEISSLYENAVTAEFISIENSLEKKLSDVCEKITDGTHQTPKYFDEGYIFLSSKNVTSRKIDWENVRYIDEAQHIQMHKRIAPRIGDVLLAKNGTTGVAAIVDRDLVFDIYVSLAWLRSKGDVLPEYLLEFVNSKMARDQFTSRTKGIGVPNLHLQEIREVIIRFPQDKEKQKLLIKKLKNIDDACNRCKQINKQKHQNLVSLKTAILAQELQPTQSDAA